MLHWLSGRTDTPLGRLSLQWFRRYFEASHNSGSAATVYSFLSVFPTALVGIAIFQSSGDNAFADRLINHLHLTGSTASLVHDTFGSASSNALAASVTVVISFLIWGIGIGQIYQDVYKRAWRIESDRPDSSFSSLRPGPLFFLSPSSFLPVFLLHRKIGLPQLLPGAVLAAIVIGGLMGTAPLFIAAPVNFNGKAFGSFGVVATMLAYVFVAMTLSLVCAVFSPVWADWRRTERELKERLPAGARETEVGLEAP